MHAAQLVVVTTDLEFDDGRLIVGLRPTARSFVKPSSTPSQSKVLRRLERDDRWSDARKASQEARREWTAMGKPRKNSAPIHTPIKSLQSTLPVYEAAGSYKARPDVGRFERLTVDG